MAVELAPLGASPLPHMYVPEGRTFTIGRAFQHEITHQGISRRHCELFWAEKPELTVTALKKRLIVVQPGSPPIKIAPNSDSCRVCIRMRRCCVMYPILLMAYSTGLKHRRFNMPSSNKSYCLIITRPVKRAQHMSSQSTCTLTCCR